MKKLIFNNRIDDESEEIYICNFIMQVRENGDILDTLHERMPFLNQNIRDTKEYKSESDAILDEQSEILEKTAEFIRKNGIEFLGKPEKKYFYLYSEEPTDAGFMNALSHYDGIAAVPINRWGIDTKLHTVLYENMNDCGEDFLEIAYRYTKILIEIDSPNRSEHERDFSDMILSHTHYDAIVFLSDTPDKSGLLSWKLNADEIYVNQKAYSGLKDDSDICKNNKEKLLSYNSNESITVDGLSVFQMNANKNLDASHMIYIKAGNDVRLWTNNRLEPVYSKTVSDLQREYLIGFQHAKKLFNFIGAVPESPTPRKITQSVECPTAEETAATVARLNELDRKILKSFRENRRLNFSFICGYIFGSNDQPTKMPTTEDIADELLRLISDKHTAQLFSLRFNRARIAVSYFNLTQDNISLKLSLEGKKALKMILKMQDNQ